jgi:hypothetical protein
MLNPTFLLKSLKTVAILTLPAPVALAALVALPAISRPALADPLNPEEPQYQLCSGTSAKDWSNQKDVEQLIIDKGYTLINVRIEKGCWEVKAFDPQREVFEFYVHPVSHEIVLIKHKVDEPTDPNVGQTKAQ